MASRAGTSELHKIFLSRADAELFFPEDHRQKRLQGRFDPFWLLCL